MADTGFTDDARVMSKGQVTIPKKVRAALGITAGDRVTFIVDGDHVRVINSDAYVLERLKARMQEPAEN